MFKSYFTEAKVRPKTLMKWWTSDNADYSHSFLNVDFSYLTNLYKPIILITIWHERTWFLIKSIHILIQFPISSICYYSAEASYKKFGPNSLKLLSTSIQGARCVKQTSQLSPRFGFKVTHKIFIKHSENKCECVS